MNRYFNPHLARRLHAVFLLIILFAIPVAPAWPDSQYESQDIIAYGKMCALAIREIPAFNCQSGEVIPITVDGGRTPDRYSPDMNCDRPSLLDNGANSDGQCVPFSRVLNFSQGDDQIVAFCRRKYIRPAGDLLFDEIDVIAHSAADGSTCWFQATGRNGQPLNAERVPPPNEETPPPGHISARAFWQSPAQVAADRCGECHDNDPFMYSPNIGQVWHLVPTDPFGWYKHIGPDFQIWAKPISLRTRNNTCVGCHRLGIGFTSGWATKEAAGLVPIKNADNWARRYPANHFMPTGNFYAKAQWDAVYAKSVREILACHDAPASPGCLIAPITGKP